MRKRYEIQGAESDPLEDFKSYESNKRKNSIHSVSPIIGIVFLVLLLGLYKLVLLIDGVLPTPLTLADEKNKPDAFISERAQRALKVLTDFGPRIVGDYENEVLAVDFLKREIESIQQHAHPNQKVELDIQTVSGSFFLDFKPYATISAYGKVQNVVAKLHSKNNSKHSLLVNAHFDSFPTSPGGSDDGINCVAALEILHKLSRSPEKMQHNVVFLFNGAEETPLQAAHGFITQHKWAKEVGVVINLEAAGAGGKEILFQAGPGQRWLLNYYNQVPHPNGQATAEELFQSGVIPSDTDFRIFRDFGSTIGLDFAFNQNGYVYHTKFDGFLNIPAGSYQHVGDNMLLLIRKVANGPELADPQAQPKEGLVFYDYLGLFMISYSETATVVINVIISILSTFVALRSFYELGLGFSLESLKYLGLTLGVILLGWVAAGLLVVATALCIDEAKFTMSWYNNPWILFGLYGASTSFCCCGSITVLNHFRSKNSLSVSTQTQIQAHLLRLIWTVPLLIGTFLGIRSVYVILVPLLFQTLAAGIILIFSLHYSVRKWQIIYVLGTVIPNMFLMKVATNITQLFVVICGRMGSAKNPELYLSIVTLAMTILIMSYYTPLITLVRKPFLLLAALVGVFLLFFLIVFTPLGFPYSGNPESPAPQRFWIYHNSRIFRTDTNDVYKKDAGFFLMNMDHNSPHSVKRYVKDLSNARSVVEDCKRSLLCGLPVSNSRLIALLPQSSWVPAEEPIIHEPIKLELNSKTSIIDTVTSFNFTASGPSQLAIYVSPRTDAKLIKTSLTPKVQSEPDIWNGRPLYVITYVWGKENTPLTFSLDFETPANWSRATFDVALAGVYKHDKINVKTPHFKRFLSEFPDWADVIAWLGTYESWVY